MPRRVPRTPGARLEPEKPKVGFQGPRRLPGTPVGSVEISVTRPVVEVDVTRQVVDVTVTKPVIEVTAPGPQGRRGPVGPQGPQGVPGRPLNVLGTLLVGTLPEQFPLNPPPAPGDTWIVGPEMYVFDGLSWQATLRGPVGPQGPPGPDARPQYVTTVRVPAGTMDYSTYVNHAMNTYDVAVTVYRESTGAEMEPEIVRQNLNEVWLRFGRRVLEPADSVRIIVRG